MKRFYIVLAVLLSFLTVCGCGVQAAQPSSASTPEPETDEITIAVTEKTEEAMAVQTLPPTPAVSPDPTDEPTALPSTAPAKASETYAAGDGIYTIAWMSDPQHYSKKFPETYYAMTSFLHDHREEMHLEYVINTGDLVHNPDEQAQWDGADRAQAMIDEIPNGVLAGNHDVLDPVGYTTFSKLFGEKRYQGKPWYGESYENNRGHYDLLTLGETDYLFVYMGFGPDHKAIQWVKDAFAKYPDRVGILCLHDYYTKTQTLSDDGKRWHDEVVVKSPNLYMVLCGHKYGAYCFPESFDDDGDGRDERTVYQMLFNYQATAHDGGGGYLRLMQINEADGTMHNLTYSPLLDDFNRFDDPANREKNYDFDERNEEFNLPLPWRIEH